MTLLLYKIYLYSCLEQPTLRPTHVQIASCQFPVASAIAIADIFYTIFPGYPDRPVRGRLCTSTPEKCHLIISRNRSGPHPQAQHAGRRIEIVKSHPTPHLKRRFRTVSTNIGTRRASSRSELQSIQIGVQLLGTVQALLRSCRSISGR